MDLNTRLEPADIQYLDLNTDRITGHSNRAWFVTCMQQLGYTDTQQSQCLGWALHARLLRPLGTSQVDEEQSDPGLPSCCRLPDKVNLD